MSVNAEVEYQDNGFFGHPRGLLICFATELWERFSYYGMRALLLFYLTKHFLFKDEKAHLIYGAYTAMVYVMPVIGGILADRYLGARKAVTFGALLLVLGHFGMAFEGPAASMVDGAVQRNTFYEQVFYLSLALIIMGVGFLKANISTIVGSLYQQQDSRRDSGFTIFYMGINLGALIAASLCGWLGETFGWAYGFGMAGIGMLFGLLVFLKGQHLLQGRAEPPDPGLLKARLRTGLTREHSIYLGAFVGTIVVWQLIQHQELVGNLLMGFGGIMLFVVLVYAFSRCTPVERDRLLVASGLIVFSVLFWSLFEQAGSSLNLFADRYVDRQLLGWEIPASMFQSLNPFFIITLAPLFAYVWIWLAKRGWEPSTPVKFALAICMVGAGFLVLVFGSSLSSAAAKTGLVWLVLIYLLHTMGELCISPVGLSMITKLSVARIVGMMMGVWFLASAGANYIASLIARLTSVETQGGVVVDQASATANVMAVYTNVGLLAIAVSIVLLMLAPLMKKFMHGVH